MNWKLHVWACIFFMARPPAQCEPAAPPELSESGSVVLHMTNITRLTAKAIHEAGYRLHKVEHLSVLDAPRLEHVAVEDLPKMPNLKSIFISQAPRLHKIAPLPALPELRTLYVQPFCRERVTNIIRKKVASLVRRLRGSDNSILKVVADDPQAPVLRHLVRIMIPPEMPRNMVTTSGLLEVPNLSHVHDSKKANMSYLQAIDLEGNHIKWIPKHALRVRADQVSLSYNLIEEVPAFAFKNAQISRLSFRGNTKLKRLDDHAFSGNLLLRQLDLSNTAITSLPTKGLEKLQILRIEKTPSLKYIPSIYEFQHLEKAYLTHHFHCCAFEFPERHDPARHQLHQAQLAQVRERCLRAAGPRRRRALDPIREIRTRTSRSPDDEVAQSSAPAESEYSSELEEYVGDSGSFEDEDQGEFHEPVNSSLGGAPTTRDCDNFTIIRRKVNCSPRPDALNPCEDVMGWAWLRACVWLVVAAAVVGNVAVLLVLLTNHAELTVPRFLMCHLAFSDLCTGLYLLMIAVVDLRSYGEFFNYAYDWQYGVGCKIAGFFSVFSGQLSVFTLTIVTLERWFAITYAIYLERRISLPVATKIMLAGWWFSVLMAGLPLAGVSDYSSTSICLPVESKDVGDAVYQGALFLTTAVAWVTIVVCYVQIYRSLGGGESYGGRSAAAAAEKKIANKMALLIGTDLLCWAPVAFFGVTALAGVPLVDVSHGKVLLVFFYPLNACANPFLYAILTKQYRRDLITLVARTGRCNWLVERHKLANPPPTGHTNPSAPHVPLVDYKRSQSYQSQPSKEYSEVAGM